MQLSDDIGINNTIFIKSSLGTGKTQRLSEIVDKMNCNTLILSHRVTFTNSMKSRYNNLICYNDIEGTIDFTNTNVVAC